MLAHLRANLLLLVATVVLCCGVYPLALWAVGQAVFHEQANGSLIHDKDGKPIASRLLAHKVDGAQYFQPRPSATAQSEWNAAASGATNFGANNYLLRDAVARRLGPIARYPNGAPVAPDVVKWFRTQADVVAKWATDHPGVAQAQIKNDEALAEYVKQWCTQHPAAQQSWRAANPDKDAPTPDELAVPFFTNFATEHPGTWYRVADNQVVLVPKEADDPADVAAVFFALWRDAHPNVALEPVPADLVTTSGSGLDPHITLAGARYQLPTVAAEWRKLIGIDLRDDIALLLETHARAPLLGAAGVPLVNVAEINLELHRRYAGKIKE